MHLSLTSLVVVLCMVAVAPVSGIHKARTFRVDLETPPEQRWKRVLQEYDIEVFRKLAKEVIDTFIPKILVPSLNALISPLDEFIPEPYAAEIKGIAKTSGLGVGEVVGLNIVYDVTAFCTSIVAEDTQGNIFHARNLDYKVTRELKNITSVVTYYRGGLPEYTTTSFLGQVGAFTGMRPHEFTISLNERDQGSIEKNLEALFESLLLKRGTLTSFILRDVIATKRNYQEAVASLAETPLVAPVYIIVGGVRPGEGVVITRDQKHADLWRLDVKSGRWWLLETNYDHWVEPPAHDDRRDPGNKAMMKVGQANINERTLFEVLSVHPVLNNNTAYTCLMTAARPELYDTVIRD